MEKVIIMTETLNSDPIAKACGNYAVVRAMSVREMISSLAEEPATMCLILQAERYGDEFISLLQSITNTFPLLDACVFTERPDVVTIVNGYEYLDSAMAADDIQAAVTTYLKTVTSTNQRRYNRFNWPLKAWLRDEQDEWHQFRVHSLSAGGAYLEYGKGVPDPGSLRMIRLEFQNCRMTTDAEILDVRRSSSNLPYGFGVKFSGLNDESVLAIDTIVKNALVAKLLDEESEPEIPSIGEDDITFQFDLS